jgi:hypothetical protein
MANQIKDVQVKHIKVVTCSYTYVSICLTYRDWLKVCRKQGWHVTVITGCKVYALNYKGNIMSHTNRAGLAVFYSK